MNRITRTFAVVLSAAAAAFAAVADETQESSTTAIVRLLNSRAAGSPKDYARAVETVAADAAKGLPLQQFVIAVISRDAEVPAKFRLTETKRKEYLSMSRGRIRALAEEKGNALAWYLLSLEANDMKYLKRAADGENIQALNAYGTITLVDALRNPNIETNELNKVLSKSRECFKKAADLGDPNGLYNLGMCYMHGYGCQIDQDLALKSFRTSAEAGHPEAINNMGGFFRDGIVVSRNPEAAVQWFERSANLGNSYGQLNFGLALQRGEGIEKDEARAATLFRDAATQGNAEAMNAYGMCFYSGTGVEKDEIAAVRWFRASAERGCSQAMENLATCYDKGFGVRKDVNEGTIWKVRAMAARGDRNAAAWLKQNGY